MIDKLEKTIERYNELSRLLSDSSVISNPELFKKYSIEYKELEPIVNLYMA